MEKKSQENGRRFSHNHRAQGTIVEACVPYCSQLWLYGLPVTAQQEPRSAAAVKTLRCTAYKTVAATLPTEQPRHTLVPSRLTLSWQLSAISSQPLPPHSSGRGNVPSASNQKSRKNVLVRSSTPRYSKADDFSTGKKYHVPNAKTRTCSSISPSLLSVVFTMFTRL